jgi:hypothetical protein
MSKRILTAAIAIVQIGYVKFEGLMDEEGNYYVAVPQLVTLDLIPPDRSLKQLQAIHSNAFQTHVKLKTALHPKAVNAIPLRDLEGLILELAIKGNQAAIDLARMLVGLSLQQVFSDAFGIKFEQEERQKWLKTRQAGKQVRYSLTDAIKWWLENNEVSDNTRKWIYANCSDAVNLGLFGRKASKLCVDLQVPDKNKLRDALTDKELLWLSEIEHLAARLIIKQGWEPVPAVKEAIDRLVLDRVSRSVIN